MDAMTVEIPAQTAKDRCDVCGSQAFIAVLMRIDTVEPLRFCGHHGRLHMPAVLAQEPFAVRDDIALLHVQS
jgi:hypothetical protein